MFGCKYRIPSGVRAKVSSRDFLYDIRSTGGALTHCASYAGGSHLQDYCTPKHSVTLHCFPGDNMGICSVAMENQGTGTLCQSAILALTDPSILRAVSPFEGEVRS